MIISHAGDDDAEFGTEITYEVQYKDAARDDWFVFTGHKYKHAVNHGMQHSETYSMAEALTTAQDLLSGKLLTDERPRYRAHVIKTRIVQRTIVGGVLLTLDDNTEDESR